MNTPIHQFLLKDSGIFPNSKFPALHYTSALPTGLADAAGYLTDLFAAHGWSNNWKAGIFTCHHFHSTAHEVLGIADGRTKLMLGGEGLEIHIAKGDVLVIPAGVAHKNLGGENDVICIGGYAGGRDYDINEGKPGERPKVDRNIANVPFPDTDPVFGGLQGLPEIWANYQM